MPSTQTTSSPSSPPLRKLTLWSKCNLALLHLFCAVLYVILRPLGLAPAGGAAFISAMFGLMMFVPPLTCWILVKFTDAWVWPGLFETLVTTKHIWATIIVACYLYTVATDRAPKTVVGGNHRPPRNAVNAAAQKLYFWGIFDYFPVTVVPWSDDATLPLDRQYVFGVHPHGIICWGLYVFAARGTPFDERFPGLCGARLHGLVATVLFRLPVLRDFFLEWPYVDASRNVASDALAAGHSIYVVPGGEEECVLTSRGEDVVVLSRRKGFVRLALSYGADLVPVFGAGTTDAFITYPNVFGFRRWVQKRLGVAFEVWRGRCFTPLPFQGPVRVLIGEPIRTPTPAVKGDKPDEKLVEEYHTRYMEALKELHKKHVADRPLKVL